MRCAKRRKVTENNGRTIADLVYVQQSDNKYTVVSDPEATSFEDLGVWSADNNSEVLEIDSVPESQVQRGYLLRGGEDSYRGDVVYDGFLLINNKWYYADLVGDGVMYQCKNFNEQKLRQHFEI